MNNKCLKQLLTKEDYDNLLENIKELINQGYSRRKIAKELNISVDNLKTIFKQEKITTTNISDKTKAIKSHLSLEERTKLFAEALHKKDNTKVYYSGFKNIDSNCYIKCLNCNTVYKLHPQAIRGRHSKIQCKVCDEIELNKRKEQKEIEQIYKQTKRYLRRKANNLFSDEQIGFNICEYCGDLFIGNNKYCSIKCQKKKAYHKADRLRIERAKANGEIDNTITLAKLIKRDNNICYICNKECNLSDYTYVGNTFVAGNYYPSIDHIVPLSKGGVHKWHNIKLAHRVCNSKKGNKIF